MKSRGIAWKDVFLAVVGSGVSTMDPDAGINTGEVDDAGRAIFVEPNEEEKAERRRASAAEVVAYARAVADAAQESFDRDREEEMLGRGAGAPAPYRPSPQELGKIPGLR